MIGGNAGAAWFGAGSSLTRGRSGGGTANVVVAPGATDWSAAEIAAEPAGNVLISRGCDLATPGRSPIDRAGTMSGLIVGNGYELAGTIGVAGAGSGVTRSADGSAFDWVSSRSATGFNASRAGALGRGGGADATSSLLGAGDGEIAGTAINAAPGLSDRSGTASISGTTLSARIPCVRGTPARDAWTVFAADVVPGLSGRLGVVSTGETTAGGCAVLVSRGSALKGGFPSATDILTGTGWVMNG